MAGLAVAAMAVIWFLGRGWLADLHDRAADFNGAAVVAALTVLPLVGVPVSVMHAITGAKFGWAVGLPLVLASILVQMVASYALVRIAPDFFARRFARLRQRLPATTHRSLTLFTILLPGAPYFAQNYLLAVVGVPFRVFLGYCFPIHAGRSLIGILFGEWSGHLTPARGAVFAAYAVGVTVACGLAFRRLRAQLKNQPPAVGGRKPRVSAGCAAR